MAIKNNTPTFTIGQRVKAIAFTDCFGKFVPERTGLTVTEIRPINGQSIPAYFRVKADDPDGIGYVEGAERYFTAECGEHRKARETIIEAKDYFMRTWSGTETENRAFGSLRLAYEYAGFDHVRAMNAATRELNRKRGA